MANGATGGLVFFTIHGNGNQNPRSVILLPELSKINGVRETLEICSDVGMDFIREAAKRARIVVAVFDLSWGVNYWSPRRVSAKNVPRWVSESAAKWAVGVGERAVKVKEDHSVVKSSIAGQIVTMFSSSNGDKDPWVTTIHPRTRGSRRREPRVPRYDRFHVGSSLLW